MSGFVKVIDADNEARLANEAREDAAYIRGAEEMRERIMECFYDQIFASPDAYREHIRALPTAPKPQTGMDVCSICRQPVIGGKWHEHATE